MTINGVVIELGKIVRFHTLNNKETQLIQSTVIGMIGYEQAKGYGDILNYHQEVLTSQPTAGLPSTPEAYTFMLLKDHQGIVRVMAPDWIQEASFEEVDSVNIIDIKVYGIPSQNKQDILNLLRDNGYIVE